MPKSVKTKDYTMLSAGLPANPPPAVGVALVEAKGEGTAWLRRTMRQQSPVLTGELISAALNLGYDRP